MKHHNPLRSLLSAAILAPFVLSSSQVAAATFNSVDDYNTVTNGLNGWSYGSVTNSQVSNLRTNTTLATYDSGSSQWKVPYSGTSGVLLNATSQNYYAGVGYDSVRYWTADQDYGSLTFASSMDLTYAATGRVYYSTDLGTQVNLLTKSAYNSSTPAIPTTLSLNSSSIANQTIEEYGPSVLDGVIYNVSAGDRIYWVMSLTGQAGDSNNKMQPFTMTVTAVPEPSTVALVVMGGLLGLVVARKRVKPLSC